VHHAFSARPGRHHSKQRIRHISRIFDGLRQSRSPKAAPDLGQRLAALRNSLAAGAGSNSAVTANGSVKISLEGFPRGTRTTTKLAGMFRDINVDRGNSMPWAAG
jgi:hypothetical protein